MGQNDDQSASIQVQLKKWNVFLDSWVRPLSEDKEVSVIGNVNLDFLKWKRNDLPPNDSSLKLRSLTNSWSAEYSQMVFLSMYKLLPECPKLVCCLALIISREIFNCLNIISWWPWSQDDKSVEVYKVRDKTNMIYRKKKH